VAVGLTGAWKSAIAREATVTIRLLDPSERRQIKIVDI
jgi:hypothetical protein